MKVYAMKNSILLAIIFSIIYVVYGQQTLVDVSTQAACTDSGILGPSSEDRWAQAGLDTDIDVYLKCGEIIAFKLQWFSGTWSDWFVVGVNDVDSKSDGSSLTLKRMWSYFADHTHQYIICTQNKFKGCTC